MAVASASGICRIVAIVASVPGVVDSIFRAPSSDPPSSQAFVFDALAIVSKREYQTESLTAFTGF